MKESNKNGIIAFLVLVIIGLASSFGYYYYTNEHTEETVATNEKDKINVADKAILLAVGETNKLSDYIEKIDDVDSAMFETGGVFSIDKDYVITALNQGNDFLKVTYKDGSIIKYSALCEMPMIYINIGEEVDLTKYINTEKTVKEITSDNETFTISNNKVMTSKEEEAIITIIYTDETENEIKIKCKIETSNAKSKTEMAPRYVITICTDKIPGKIKNKDYYKQFKIVYNTADQNYYSIQSPLVLQNDFPKMNVAGYDFLGYFLVPNGKGLQITDKNGMILPTTNKLPTTYIGNSCIYPAFHKKSNPSPSTKTTTSQTTTKTTTSQTTTKTTTSPIMQNHTVWLKDQIEGCKGKKLEYKSKDFCVKVLKTAFMNTKYCSVDRIRKDDVFRSVARNCVESLQRTEGYKVTGKTNAQVWTKLKDIIKMRNPAVQGVI